MPFANRFLTQVLVYTVLIFGVMYWSGTSIEKTIYHTYQAELDGLLLPTSQPEQTADFFHRVLEFDVLKTDDGRLAGVRLPSRQIVYFRTQAEPGKGPPIVIGVRNGFRKLQKHVLKQSGKPPVSADAPGVSSVTEIVTRPWGREFTVYDPNGNEIIFIQPVRRYKGRF